MDATTRALNAAGSAASLGLVAVVAAAGSLLLFPSQASTVSSDERHYEHPEGCFQGCSIGVQLCCMDSGDD